MAWNTHSTLGYTYTRTQFKSCQPAFSLQRRVYNLAVPMFSLWLQSDVYSLGVIFLEMFHKMSTMMEVMKVAQNLQNGCLPAEVKKKKAWKKQVSH